MLRWGLGAWVFSVSSLLIRSQVGSPSSLESCVDSAHHTGLSGPSCGVPGPGESQGPQGRDSSRELARDTGQVRSGHGARVVLSLRTCCAGGKPLQSGCPNEGHLQCVLPSR